MRLSIKVTIGIAILCCGVSTSALDITTIQTDYKALHDHLLHKEGVIIEVDSFEYKKDVATFMFKDGRFIFQNAIQGRPTTAIFVGRGSVVVQIPPVVERRSVQSITGDSVVAEEFEVCVIRFADDLDLELQSRFSSREGAMTNPEFRKVTRAHGERFFEPTLYHLYDNYFQLLRSAYSRESDGFFFAGFGRYVYKFDPTLPEEVYLGYEFQPVEMKDTPIASFQRSESAVYDTDQMSQLNYPFKTLQIAGNHKIAGSAGLTVDGEGHLKAIVQRDSVQFVTMFLHSRLKIDSASCNGNTVSVHRRRDFNAVGLILPEYAYKNDTLHFKLWYQGRNVGRDVPYLPSEDVTDFMYFLTLPKDYNCITPVPYLSTPVDDTLVKVSFKSAAPVDYLSYTTIVTGYDTTALETTTDIPVMLIEQRIGRNSRDNKKFNEAVVAAFEYFHDRSGSIEDLRPAGVAFTAEWDVNGAGTWAILNGGVIVMESGIW